MRALTRRFLFVLLPLLVAAANLQKARGAETNQSPANASEAEERAACIRNLEAINKAIKAYQKDHRDLPMWLSDLVPQYLQDPNLLVCPSSRRTGRTESAPYADPKLPTSYVFEFSPAPMGNAYPAGPTHTRREWKRRQMGVVGSAVPLVRCRQHTPTLNLCFDGRIVEYPAKWESAFTNVTTLESLDPATLFASEAPSKKNTRFPPRTPRATPRQLDLGDYFNVALTENWLGKTNQNLGALPKGLQMVDGINFEIRGLVQLAGRGLSTNFPSQVLGIPVKLKCKRLHFLHATAGEAGETDTQVGSYMIKFAGNPARLTIPIMAGIDVQCWDPASKLVEDGARPASFVSDAAKGQLKTRLFKTTWNNLAPDLEVESIDIASDRSKGGLFIIAITGE